jgi:PIN domain nuclease of toxin-antitoxin system
MKVLLDTHAFLWFLAGDTRLSKKGRMTMESADTELFLSAASIWEMAIKVSLDRLSLPLSVKDYVAEKIQDGFRVLPIEWEHAAAVQTLPFHHRDPFDRLLVVQAARERMPLITGDPIFRAYGSDIIW